MQLYAARKVNPDKSGLLCRQSRVGSILGIAVLSAILVGAPVMWRLLEAPWPLWGGCAALALALVPLLLHDLLLRLRSSNWLLWIRRDGLWINFRSYQDAHAPDDAPAVVHVPFSEIKNIQPLVESYTTPSGDRGSSVHRREESLLIHLKDNDAGALREALAAERSRKPAERTVLGFIHIASKATHFPVSVSEPSMIRLAWRGSQGNCVSPNLKRVLEHVDQVANARIAIATEPQRQDLPSWDEMDEAQLDELIRRHVESGDRIEAIRLLVRRKGYSTTEAHRRIEALLQE